MLANLYQKNISQPDINNTFLYLFCKLTCFYHFLHDTLYNLTIYVSQGEWVKNNANWVFYVVQDEIC